MVALIIIIYEHTGSFFEEFEIFIERSGEKSTSAQIVETFFRLLKLDVSEIPARFQL